MAIKRAKSNPIVILDVVIAGIEQDFKSRYEGTGDQRKPVLDPATGEVVKDYVGRRLDLQTGMPNSDFLELRVSSDFDGVQFSVGEQRLIVAEYSEYDFNGRSGSILKWLADVSPAQAEQWAKSLKQASQG